ncbi:MAG: exo-alpha-sialidase [bacterium]|nr:exo-alpha-sialidase [bacterium]
MRKLSAISVPFVVLMAAGGTWAEEVDIVKFDKELWADIRDKRWAELYQKWIKLIRRGQPVLLVLLVTAGLMIVSCDQAGNSQEPAPLQISGDSPFDGCTADDPASQLGEVFHDSEVEPWVAVNPRDPNHVVASWQQDRWSNGGARGLVAGVSFDGGRHWLEVPLPGLTPCTGGGEFIRASDPWLTFNPNGDIYHIALLAGLSLIELIEGRSETGRSAMVVQKSTSGGLSWSDPVTLVDEEFEGLHDKQSITADPHDPNFVYAAWDRVDFETGKGPAWFSRTADGGVSWEKAREIYDPGSNGETLGHQIVVLPDGTVIDFFTKIEFDDSTVSYQLALMRSSDRGRTWGDPIIASSMEPSLDLADPDMGMPIRGGEELFDVAVDPRRGTLYAVWQDARFGDSGQESIALSVSEDGGTTWSVPVKINKTPTDIPTVNQQAFVPSVAVNSRNVAVTYYDFRLNSEEPGALTDYWAVTCLPRHNFNCAHPGSWKNEIRLTDASFDLLDAPDAGGLFLGDYAGLAAAGNGFIAIFGLASFTDPAGIYSRRF